MNQENSRNSRLVLPSILSRRTAIEITHVASRPMKVHHGRSIINGNWKSKLSRAASVSSKNFWKHLFFTVPPSLRLLRECEAFELLSIAEPRQSRVRRNQQVRIDQLPHVFRDKVLPGAQGEHQVFEYPVGVCGDGRDDVPNGLPVQGLRSD